MGELTDLDQQRIEIATKLFAGWSSGNPDAPEPYFHADAVLFDVASGQFEGWPAIRAFFARGLTRSHELTLVPDRFWVRPDGLALHYVMSATIADPASYGPEYVGRRWSVDVMSELRFDGHLVVYEADYHDKGSRTRSLGITPR
jgi:hypothetical protein